MPPNESTIDLVLKARAATQAAFAEVEKQLDSLGKKTLEATGAGEGWSAMLSKAGGLLSAMGIGLSVGALVSFAKGLVDSAGALADLSNKTGASIEQLQRWAFVGNQAGVSTEQFNDALFKLGARLAGGAGGGKGVRQAVEELGLSWETLKASSPDAQFNAVVKSLEEMTDSGERNRLGLEIFGKSFAGIAPAVAKGYTEMAASATVSSAAQIQAIDAQSDRWDRFVANQKASLTSFGGDLVQLTQTMGFFGTALTLASGGGQAYVALLDAMKERTKNLEFIGPLQIAQAAAVTNYTTELVKAMIEVDRMSRAEIAAVEAGQRLGKSVDEITEAYGISEGALKVLTERTKAHEQAIKDAATATDKAAKIEAAAVLATSKLWEEYYALRVTHGGTANETALAQIKKWEADGIAAAIKAGTATKAFYDGLAALSKEKTAGVGIDWDLIKTRSIESLRETAANHRKTYEEMLFGSKTFTREALAEQLAKTREAEAAARGMGTSYKEAYEAAEKKAQDLLKVQQELRAEERKRQLESRQLGGAFAVTSQNFAQSLTEMITNGGFNPTGRGSTIDSQRAYQLARQGYSWQEILDIFNRPAGPIPPAQGPRIPGFRDEVQNFEGGLAYVHRDELLVNLPRGTDVVKAGRGGVGSTTTIVNVYVGNVLSSKQELARYVEDALVTNAMAKGGRFGGSH